MLPSEPAIAVVLGQGLDRDLRSGGGVLIPHGCWPLPTNAPDPVLRKCSGQVSGCDRGVIPVRVRLRPLCRGGSLVAGRPLTSPASSSGLLGLGPGGWSNLQGSIACADLDDLTRTAAGIALCPERGRQSCWPSFGAGDTAPPGLTSPLVPHHRLLFARLHRRQSTW